MGKELHTFFSQPKHPLVQILPPIYCHFFFLLSGIQFIRFAPPTLQDQCEDEIIDANIRHEVKCIVLMGGGWL